MAAVEEYREHVLSGSDGFLIPDNSFSQALEAAHRVKSGAGFLCGFTVNNTKASAQYILLFDKQTAPVANDIPVTSFTIAASSDKGVEWLRPRPFTQGIWLANSSTSDKLTAGSADCWFDAQYL